MDNILVGIGWIVLNCIHLIGKIPKHQKILMVVLSSVGMLAIALNFFMPLIFYVDKNSVYHREVLFWLFTGIQVICVIDGICVYSLQRRKG